MRTLKVDKLCFIINLKCIFPRVTKQSNVVPILMHRFEISSLKIPNEDNYDTNISFS